MDVLNKKQSSRQKKWRRKGWVAPDTGATLKRQVEAERQAKPSVEGQWERDAG